MCDLNRQGHADIVFFRSNASQAVRFGNCDGTFGNPIALRLSGDGLAMTCADCNHDGKPDLAFAIRDQGQVEIFLNASR